MPLEVLKVLVVRPVLPCSAGSSISDSKIFGLAALSRSADDRLVVGVGCEKPRAAMREPDTTTVFTSSGSGAAGVAPAGLTASAGTCWAWPGIDRMPQALATARLIMVR
jgi:hypothetical protein